MHRNVGLMAWTDASSGYVQLRGTNTVCASLHSVPEAGQSALSISWSRVSAVSPALNENASSPIRPIGTEQLASWNSG